MRNALLALLVCVLGACSKTAPEQAILEQIETLQQAVEDRSAGRVIEGLSDQFRGNAQLDKREMHRMLVGLFLRHKEINMVITKMDITVNPDDPLSATMQGAAIVTGAQHLIPDDGRVYSVAGHWQKLDGDWLLVSLTWD